MLSKEKKEAISFKTAKFENWKDFAKIIAWYGRKNGATTYLKDVYFEER